MSHFVLVHGAWHGAWCWNRVVPLLEELGHSVDAIDLPGHGDDPTPPANVGIDDYVRATGEALAKGSESAVLVGHSMGGLVISGAAEEHAAKIDQLVYLAAILPGDTGAILDGSELTAHTRLAPDEGVIHLDGAAAREIFYHDCDPEEARRAESRLCPQPIGMGDPRSFPDLEGYKRLPCHYIECLQDRALRIDGQRAAHGRIECTVHTLDSSHSPFLSAPQQLG